MTWITRQVSNKTANGTAFSLTGAQGAPVLALVHGLGLCRHVFDAMLPAFKDYRVLTYDLWGHGQSDPAPRNASLRVFADQLADLLLKVT